MEFRTEVKLPKGELSVRHTDRILLLGSCFAENIGQRLIENKFSCDVNPFGVLYNPLSIAQALKEIKTGKVYKEKDIFYHSGQWHSWMHHSSFSSFSQEECLKPINDRLKTASKKLAETNYLFLTLGTAYVYLLKETGQIVGNCHKLSESNFIRRLLTVEETVEHLSKSLQLLWTDCPSLRVLFSVSPIRHTKDGMHGNQLSKSVLLLAVHRLKELFADRVFYFPSYELMMDELRDYRFYAEDMLHPSSLAVEYLWECFSSSYFSGKTCDIIREWKEVSKALNHKPFDEKSTQYKSFLMQIVLKMERIKEKYPYLDVEKELKLCHTLLKR